MNPDELKAAIGKLSIFGWKFPDLKDGEVPASVLGPDGRAYTFLGAMAAWEAEHGETKAVPDRIVVAGQSTKLGALTRFLGIGQTMLIVDATDESVTVPKQFLGNQCLALNISKNFKNPISITEFGIMAKLSFGNQPFMCVIPWGSIRGMISHVTHEGQRWVPDQPTTEVTAVMGEVDAIMARRPKVQRAPDTTTLSPLSTTIERFDALVNEIRNLDDPDEIERRLKAMIRAGTRKKG